ncbi:hypothetical protein C2G38_2187031 [Gigaspora rosea]|uniref:Uncharacterized protein n=1 Tax=Gigaspora rosea TaxID=44941 RepID=A0A397V6L2_9GLOM|nr:hypothetical protein C2G38_2187031 [Gigaspora rosea]
MIKLYLPKCSTNDVKEKLTPKNDIAKTGVLKPMISIPTTNERKFRTNIIWNRNDLTQQKLQNIEIPSCSLDNWNNEILMEKKFFYHLKRRTISSINWQNFFNEWQEQGMIIELHNSLKRLYPMNYQFNARKINAWRIMLRCIGCHNITPCSKQNSELYELGFLTQPIVSSNIFWNSFNKSLIVNKNGENGKLRILSIIANDFKYKDLQENLLVSNDLISKAHTHYHLYGPGNSTIKKPSYTREKLPTYKLQEFKNFINDKAHGSEYIYREDLGGLCSTCSHYRYEIFDDIRKLIESEITDIIKKDIRIMILVLEYQDFEYYN